MIRQVERDHAEPPRDFGVVEHVAPLPAGRPRGVQAEERNALPRFLEEDPVAGAERVAAAILMDLDAYRVARRTRDTRPLLKTEDPKGTLARLMEARYPIYAEADVSVISRDVKKERMVEEVLEAVAALKRT